MNSIERVGEYCELACEPPTVATLGPAAVPPAGWPSAGSLEFRALSVRYELSRAPLVLDSLSLALPPKCKCGVVGRTGAGKSTLTLAVLRLVDAASGSILLDGVDIARVPLDVLRSVVTVVPQEPM